MCCAVVLGIGVHGNGNGNGGPGPRFILRHGGNILESAGAPPMYINRDYLGMEDCDEGKVLVLRRCWCVLLTWVAVTGVRTWTFKSGLDCGQGGRVVEHLESTWDSWQPRQKQFTFNASPISRNNALKMGIPQKFPNPSSIPLHNIVA